MAAGVLDIVVEQGSTFSRTITLRDGSNNPINLTGATVRGQLRPEYTSDIVVPFVLSITAPATSGTIAWSLSAADSARLSSSPDVSWVYDIEVEYAGGVVERVLQGQATISPEVTR